jgi:2-polyprenyl-3-methyl-5-hydroxy-6-metoxy-1,4-benzoquinol methylase
MKKCNFCNNILEHIYTPYNSKINLEIFICVECGLVQSDYDQALYEESNVCKKIKFDHLGCDANYSDIRVGKQQMVKYIFDIFDNLKLKHPIKKVLDMRSARGHFALRALDYFNIDSIDCIEEDIYMLDNYKNNSKINIINTKYHQHINYDYDLIYSCHSLEHYQNPSKYLKFVRTLLNTNGYFYIDVPNLNNINHQNNIDEFFYDKHLYYYDAITLINFIENIGFELVTQKISNQNIGLLFYKSDNINLSIKNNQYIKNKNLIRSYIYNIKQNRNKLNNISVNFNSGNNIIFGCGRPLDALVKYANLNLNQFNFLVDDFLSEITDTIYGKPLYNSSILKNNNIDNMLLMVKEPDILLTKFKNIPNILTLSKLLHNE